MLNNNSICLHCYNKSICNKLTKIVSDLSIDICVKNCDFYVKNKNEQANNKVEESNTNIISSTNTSTNDSNIDDINDMGYKIYNDYSNVATKDKDKEKEEKNKEEDTDKGVCSICGEEKKLIKCSKCGKEVCYNCSDTYKDMNTNEIEHCCYNCMEPIDTTEDFCIDSFIDDKDKSTINFDEFVSMKNKAKEQKVEEVGNKNKYKIVYKEDKKTGRGKKNGK